MKIVVTKRKETKAMAIGDIYQLNHKFRDFDNKLCMNIYFYRQNAAPAVPAGSASERLALDWNTDILTTMLLGTPSNFISYGIEATNLFDAGDQYSLGISRAGGRSMVAQENMPTFTNAVVTMSTSNGAIKKGRKSFTGILEADNNGGVLTGAGAAFAATKGALTQLSITGALVAGLVFQPVVVKRILNMVTGNYELPGIIGEAIYGVITSAVASNILSTMVSRKK